MNVEANSTDTTDGRHDDKPRPYWCNVCHKRFARRRYLNIHERMHSEEKTFQCTDCEKHYSSQSTLGRHMNIHRAEYMCRECGKCFQSGSELAVHRRSHSGEKPFECRPTERANYRPISNLCTFSKIPENVLLSRLQPHVMRSANYCKFQSAYRKSHSTETALLRVVNDIQMAAGNGQCTAPCWRSTHHQRSMPSTTPR